MATGAANYAAPASLLKAWGLFSDLSCAAYGLDLFLGAGAESVNLNSQLLCKFTVADDLYAIVHITDDAGIQKSLDINDSTILELLKLCDVDGNNVLLVIVLEASLGESSVQRHLAAFETGSRSAGTGLLTFVSKTSSLAVAGSMAAAASEFCIVGTCSRSDVR